MFSADIFPAKHPELRMSHSFTLTTNSEEETWQLGASFAAVLSPGIAIALNGQLGAGKTNLVRAVCHGLGADTSQVNSPTFVLLQTYCDGRLPVAHFDTYRLSDAEEFLAIGGDEYLLDADTICFVEWAGLIAEIFPSDHLEIDIQQVGESSRRFQFEATGTGSRAILENLRSRFENLS